MKRQHRIIASVVIIGILLIGALVLFFGEGDKTKDEPEVPVEAEWTSLMWLDGEGDLGEWNMMLSNIHFLEMAEDSDDVIAALEALAAESEDEEEDKPQDK